MKKQLKLIIFGMGILCLNLELYSQATIVGPIAGHAGGAGPLFTMWNGWDAATTIPFNIEHRGTQDINFKNGPFLTSTNRLVIRGTGAGAFAGFVGIGANFGTPQNLLHINDGTNSYLQVTNGGSGSTATDGIKFGLLGNTPQAIIAQQEGNSLHFATNGNNIAAVRMSIVGAAGPNFGFVGIGTSFINPNNLLDVNGGDIDVNTPQRSYMIADSSVLWNKGNSSNIFAGGRAGNNHGFNQPSENTYVGYKSGFMGNGCFFLACSPNPNVQNTLIGAYAGFNNTGSGAVNIGYAAGFSAINAGNTFVGYRAGFSTTTPSDNVMIGVYAGEQNTLGDNNTFLGAGTGSNSTTGRYNCFFGNNSGLDNTIHNRNNYMGFLAGLKSVGDDNIFIGSLTQKHLEVQLQITQGIF